MFCEKCGRPIPEGKQACEFCNPPVQQPEPQPAFELNMPAEGVKPQKKKGGKLPLILIALVLVAGIVLAAVNWSSINRFFVRSFGEPAEYLADVEKESAAEAAKTLADAYDSYLASYNAKGSSAEATVTVEMSDALLSVLNTALSQNGVNMDLSWVESITLTPQVDMYENTLRAELGVGLNRVSLITLSVIWDMDSQTIFVGVPELHDTYIEMDAAELLGSDAQEVAYGLAQSRDATKTILESLPEGAQLESLITRYVGLVLDKLENVEKETQTVKAGGLEQKLTVLKLELSQKDVLKLAEAVLEEAQDDKELKTLLNDLDKAVSELNGYEADLYGEFKDAVEDALDELDYIIDEAERGDFITVETFLDSSDTVVGRTVTLEMDGEEMELYYITVTEGDEFAFKAEAGTVRIDGEGTVRKGTRTGSYTLSESGTDYVTLEIEDYTQAQDGTVTGTFRLIPESALYDMMGMPTYLTSVLDAVSLELKGDSARVAIETAGSDLLALTLSGQTAKPAAIKLPNGVSIDDETGGMQWLSQLDLDGLVSRLESAGVPDAYMDTVDQFVEMFRAEFN